MNWYFWGFAIYAFLITPIGAQVGIKIGQEVKWRVQLQFAGLPLFGRKKSEQEEKTLEGKAAAKHFFAMDHRMLWRLWRDGDIQAFLKCIRLESLYVHVHLSFADAALTAMTYALFRTLLQTLAACGVRPERLNGRVEADFHAGGSQMELRGIFVCRLGRLGAAAVRIGMAVLRERAKLVSAEEEQYAAASD